MTKPSGFVLIRRNEAADVSFFLSSLDPSEDLWRQMTEEQNALDVLRFYPGMPQAMLKSSERQKIAALGAKGAGLVRLCELDMPCPEGFILGTSATEEFNRLNAQVLSGIDDADGPRSELIENLTLPEDLWEAVKEGVHWLEKKADRRFGDMDCPLLVSVRSGGTVSLPGLMETICNVGLTRSMLERLSHSDERRAVLLDCFRRFIEGYGSAALLICRSRFRAILEGHNLSRAAPLTDLIDRYLAIAQVPDDPWQALRTCIAAVILSARTKQVRDFMRTNYIREPLKTAVVIQRMVFGNLDAESGSGVVFSRNPSTGRPAGTSGGTRLFGQIIVQSQGDDVVRDLGEENAVKDLQSTHPGVCERLADYARRLELVEGCVQDIEFTLESGKLFVLQVRPAKMAPAAFLRAQLDMIEEGIVSDADVIARTDPRQLEQVLSATVTESPPGSMKLIGKGSPLVPGYATGRICFDVGDVRQFKSKNEPVIFCCDRLRLSDMPVLEVVDGIVSSQRNVLSHATLNARYLGRPSIVKASVTIDPAARIVRYGGDGIRPGILREGHTISIDAQRGLIYEDRMEIRSSGAKDPLTQRFCELVKDYSDIKVYVQAEDHETYATAKRLGADGLAYFRTDVLFFKKRVNFALCDYVLSVGTPNELRARERLQALLEKDLLRVFRTIDEDYIAIRLCKHTMYEFFPKERSDVMDLARYILKAEGCNHSSADQTALRSPRLEKMVKTIREQKRRQEDYNPILGRRGVRLATTFPQVYETEIVAILSAMRKMRAEDKEMRVEILVPYISVVSELLFVRELTDRIAAECGATDLNYEVAPVVEISGIAFEMDKIARHTNLIVIRSDKLTTSTHHLVREDAEGFLGEYVDRGWFYGDPFRVIQESTERLVQHAIEAAKRVNPSIRILVAGTHCSNEYSLGRLLDLGITEICCPPLMVPVAKLIAAKIKKTRLDGGRQE